MAERRRQKKKYYGYRWVHIIIIIKIHLLCRMLGCKCEREHKLWLSFFFRCLFRLFPRSFAPSIPSNSLPMLSLSHCLFSHYVNVFWPERWMVFLVYGMETEKVGASAKKTDSKTGRQKKAIKEACIKLHIHTRRALNSNVVQQHNGAAAVIMEHTNTHIPRAFTAQIFDTHTKKKLAHTSSERKSYKTIQAELFCEKSKTNVA